MHKALAIKVIIDCTTDESCNFKRRLGFKLHDVINTKQQTIIGSMKEAFEGEDFQSEYTLLNYRIDLYLCKYKTAVEINEYRHVDRNKDKDDERENRLKENLGCTFIRINHDEKKSNIHKYISKIYRQINKSDKKLIDDLKKELLSFKFEKIAL